MRGWGGPVTYVFKGAFTALVRYLATNRGALHIHSLDWLMRNLLTLSFLAALGCLVGSTCESMAGEWYLRMDVEGERVEGLPLYWDRQAFGLLSRDGQFREFKMQLAKGSQRIEEPFRPFSQGEMRGQLAREFRHPYEITATGNYLVVHPLGESNKWPRRFEQLYREMIVYFGTRGIDIQKPQFPLVAVVLPNKATFMKYAHVTGTKISGSVLGYYTPVSNRIFLYDASAGGRLRADWRKNAATLVHEAAHQSAYNVGLHKRLAVQPRWLVEGLGCLFEAPGVYDAGKNPTRSDRVNRELLEIYKRAFGKKGLPSGTLMELIAYDRLFQSNPTAAYTLAWAMTFTLGETEPAQYARFLALNHRKHRFEALSASQRARDFQSVFGPDVRLIESRIHRYIMALD
jgi:hypothetical protein